MTFVYQAASHSCLSTYGLHCIFTHYNSRPWQKLQNTNQSLHLPVLIKNKLNQHFCMFSFFVTWINFLIKRGNVLSLLNGLLAHLNATCSVNTISIFWVSCNLAHFKISSVCMWMKQIRQRTTNISSTMSDVGCYEARPLLFLFWWRRWLKRSSHCRGVPRLLISLTYDYCKSKDVIMPQISCSSFLLSSILIQSPILLTTGVTTVCIINLGRKDSNETTIILHVNFSNVLQKVHILLLTSPASVLNPLALSFSNLWVQQVRLEYKSILVTSKHLAKSWLIIEKSIKLDMAQLPVMSPHLQTQQSILWLSLSIFYFK